MSEALSLSELETESLKFFLNLSLIHVSGPFKIKSRGGWIRRKKFKVISSNGKPVSMGDNKPVLLDSELAASNVVSVLNKMFGFDKLMSGGE